MVWLSFFYSSSLLSLSYWMDFLVFSRFSKSSWRDASLILRLFSSSKKVRLFFLSVSFMAMAI